MIEDKNKFIEDDFDLEDLKAKAKVVSKPKPTNKTKAKLKIINTVLLFLSLIVSLLMYMIASYFIGIFINISNKNRVQALLKENTSIIKDELYINYKQYSALHNNKINLLSEEFDNDEIVGYINIQGTSISYPVVQAKDNIFYLNKDIKKHKNSHGAIFMDYENDTKLLSHNTVIYGHNMRSNSMFNNIKYYVDEEYFKNNNIIELTTLYDQTKWEVFSFYTTTTDFGYTVTTFEDKEFFCFLNTIKEKSIFDKEIDLYTSDKILTLSTCTNRFNNERFVIHAKLL
jgi:sortase B